MVGRWRLGGWGCSDVSLNECSGTENDFLLGSYIGKFGDEVGVKATCADAEGEGEFLGKLAM
jgi:hypothetical protein